MLISANKDKIEMSVLQCLILSLPYVAFAMFMNPLYVIQGVYVKYFGFSMSALAALLLVSRVFDAITDPMIGAASDWLKIRTGRRKPLVLAGGCITVVASLAIYIPPEAPSITNFAIWLFVLYFGTTLFLVPYLAWGSEVARTSKEKMRIFSFYTASGYTGLVLFYALPMLPLFATTDITPETLKYVGGVGAVIMVLGLSVCMIFVPESPASVIEDHLHKKSPFSAQSLKNIFSNRPFLIFFAANSAMTAGLGIWYSMVFIYIDIFLKAGELFSPLYFGSFLIGAGCALLCIPMTQWFRKKELWSITILLGGCSIAYTSSLTAETAGPVDLSILLLGTTIAFVCHTVLGRSILGEIIDYSTLKNRVNQAGGYFAVYVFGEKLIVAIGAAVGLGLSNFLGFDPAATVQTASAVFAIDVVILWLPLMFLTLSLILVSLIPMDERRHAIILKRLEGRSLSIKKGA